MRRKSEGHEMVSKMKKSKSKIKGERKE